MSDLDESIEKFLRAEIFAVAGASADRSKYGHQCFAALLQHGFQVYPLNPSGAEVLGHQCYANLKSLPKAARSVSIVTPPAVTETIVAECLGTGVKNIWMQPGAESQRAIALAKNGGINVISGGPCLLVVLSYWQK